MRHATFFLIRVSFNSSMKTWKDFYFQIRLEFEIERQKDLFPQKFGTYSVNSFNEAMNSLRDQKQQERLDWMILAVHFKDFMFHFSSRFVALLRFKLFVRLCHFHSIFPRMLMVFRWIIINGNCILDYYYQYCRLIWISLQQ